MAGGRVFFGAEHRPDFKYAVEHTHHSLLIELRRLRQESLMAEVIELEDVRSAFGTGRHDLGRMDFGEILTLQELAEAAHNALLQFEHGALAQVQRAEVQIALHCQIELCLVHRNRRNLRWTR